MFAVKRAKAFRLTAVAAGLLLSSSLVLSHTSSASDDLFEPLPDGATPTYDNGTSTDRSGYDSAPPGEHGETDPAAVAPSAAVAPPAEPPSDAKVETAAPAHSDVPVFDLRAKQRLAAEEGDNLQPHPLALRYPDYFTVVCEAGCMAPDEDIVYQERMTNRGPVNEPGAEMKDLPPEVAKNAVMCVGGCYHGERVAPPVADLSVGFASAAGDDTWMSNGRDSTSGQNAPAPKAKTGSRWYDRIGG